MNELYDHHDHPELAHPVIVMMLEGWIDAGYAAGTAAQTLLSELDTFPVATFDADRLLDHRARRPVMNLVDGVNTGLTWPQVEVRGAVDLDGNDLLLLVGAEPDHLWHAFIDAALDLVEPFSPRILVGLGAYPAAVPHSRPVTMSVTAGSDELAAASGLLRGSLDVPAGVQSALEVGAAERGLDALGIWAQVPHYVSGDVSPYPAAALALLEHLQSIADIRVPIGDLAADAERTRNRIDTAVAANPDHLQMLRQLETRHDELAAQFGGGPDLGDLPSAEEIAADFEQFLRDQDTDD